LGGQERFVYSLSRQLVRMGHTVIVLTSRYPLDVPSRSMEGDIKVFRSRTLMRPFRNPISPGLLFPPRLIQDADIIHTHNEHSFAANAAVLLGRQFSKPVMLSVHGRLVMASQIGDLAVRCYESSISPIIFNAATGITVTSPSEKAFLCRRYRLPPDKVSIIPVGIDLTYWDGFRNSSNPEYAWQKETCGKKVILIATQLIRRKGIDFFIRAMPFILEQEPETVLLIAGSGDQEEQLRQLVRSLHIESRVNFLGRLFDEELSRAYQTSDIFVLPSLSEGLPTCVMEAWAYEKPVVATQIDGMKDCFAEIADLVEPASSDALAAGVLKVLRNPQRAAAKGRAGRRVVEQKYCWPEITRRMVAEYETAIRQFGSRMR